MRVATQDKMKCYENGFRTADPLWREPTHHIAGLVVNYGISNTMVLEIP